MSMDEIGELHRQLKEFVEDGDFIPPDKAKKMLSLLEAAIDRQGDPDFDSLERHEEFLHPSEEVAYEAYELSNASGARAPAAFFDLLGRLDAEDAASLRKSLREFSDTMDRVKFAEGPSAAPEVFLSLPGPSGMVFWARLRRVAQALEGKDA